MSLFQELRRRNVIRVAVAYLVAAWLIMQVADVILNNIVAPDWVFKVILLGLGCGFPLTLLFAWVFEMTPEGIKREREVESDRSITRQTGKKLDRAIIGILLIALLYFVADKFVISPTERAPAALAGPAQRAAARQEARDANVAKSIAVLPLANRSADEDDQFFADGIHDDLLTQLAKVADLKVISRTSVMRYRDTEMPIPEIAEQLGVTTILEGGIQRAGEQIRINVQLIDAGSDEHLWAETYDRKMTVANLFAIQSEITRNIVGALRATLTDDEAARIDRSPTENLEALQEHMRGQQLLALRNVEDMERGKRHFERALELDPQFAPAMAGLANAYHLLFEYANISEETSVIPAMGWLGRALDIDPLLAEALMVRGELHRHLRNWKASETDFRRALELSPGNATAHLWFSNLRRQQGFDDEALTLLRRAHELDPMSRIIHVNLALQPFARGDDEAALAELKRVQDFHPDFYVAYLYEGWIYRNRGDALASLRANLKVLELDPLTNRSGAPCFDYYNLGALDVAQGCLDDYQGAVDSRRVLLQIQMALAAGERARALALFDELKGLDGDSHIATAALALGRYEVARALYEPEFPGWFGDDQAGPIAPEDFNDALDVAAILQAGGERVKAGRLLESLLASLDTGQRNRGRFAYGYMDVAAHALLGNRRAALQALETCVELPYLTGWQALRFHPFFDAIRDEPRFADALAGLEAAAARARAQALDADLL